MVVNMNVLTTEAIWCLARPDARPAALQAGLDFVCSQRYINCAPINNGGNCFLPNTLVNHASWAYDTYWKRNGRTLSACNFAGTGVIVIAGKDPSTPTCKYPPA
ncbi:hypothetical protein PIB30_068558 [Stylosanthes scabra]|uniref:X8 domain-containing protein n=1 Tax=Stylosanthes scabra TaxID=79078 RepID=A0ABU6TQA4_9FABA|nr:hypothetical protein [Stylosanthes scabra]